MRTSSSTSNPGTALTYASVPDLRDLGGYATADGRRVRPGMLYRSAELHGISVEDRAHFETLGVRTVFDLRTAEEREAQPDPVLRGSENIVIDVLADAPDVAAGLLGEKPSEQGYRELVSSDSALAGYRKLFVDLSKPRHRPALFHCTTGRDRTGWAAAATLLLMGVSDEEVMRDFLLGDAAGRAPAHPAHLEAALDEMRVTFGSIEGYFSSGLRIGPADQRHLRDAYLEA